MDIQRPSGFKKQKNKKQTEIIKKEANRLYKITIGTFGSFWATVISVELMDLAFSMDNVFAAVAFSALSLVASFFVKDISDKMTESVAVTLKNEGARDKSKREDA